MARDAAAVISSSIPAFERLWPSVLFSADWCSSYIGFFRNTKFSAILKVVEDTISRGRD